MEHDVEIKMIADVTDLKRQVSDITGDMKGLEKQIGKTGRATTFSAITQGLQMVERYGKQVIAVMQDLVKTFAEASRESTTWTVMMKHSKFSQEEIDSLREYSGELQNYTGISDEAISNTERLLLSATDLTKDGLIRATSACADLSKAMGTDITSSAQALAIALASPAEGLTRLRRSGILFTDEEEALIKKLEESGDALKAQDVMLSKIEERYGGIAKAIGDTPIGTLDKIKETWGDIKENLGESILNSVSPALNLLLDTLNAIKQWQADQKAEEEKYRGNQTVQDVVEYSNGLWAEYDHYAKGGKTREKYKDAWDFQVGAVFDYVTVEAVQEAIDWLNNNPEAYGGSAGERSQALQVALKQYIENSPIGSNEMVDEYYKALVEASFSEGGLPTTETRAILQRILGSKESDVKTLMADFYYAIGESASNPILLENLVGKTEDDLQINLQAVEEITEEMQKAEDDYKALLQAVEDYNNYAEYYKAKGDKAMANYWSNKAKAVQEQIDQLNSDEDGKGPFTAYTDALTNVKTLSALKTMRDNIEAVLDTLSGDAKDNALEALAEITESMEKFADTALGYAIPVVSAFGEAIGETMAGGEDAWKGFAKTAINTTAQIIEALGQEAIATATKDLVASKFLDSTAWAGLAKGAGIVALAGTVRGLAKFERGGIVGGTGITGDTKLIRANAGELILTRAQQNSIANQLQSGGKTTQINVAFNGTVLGDQQSVSAWVYDGIERAKYNGVI